MNIWKYFINEYHVQIPLNFIMHSCVNVRICYVSKDVLWSVRGSYQTIWAPPPLPNVTRHSGWWPPTVTPSIDQTLHQFLTLLLILTLLQNLTFYLIARGFHRTFATGAACQQRTLTPPDTWSCSTLGLASVLMLRPISPELVLSPDFWVSSIPRYFCFWLLFHNCTPATKLGGYTGITLFARPSVRPSVWRRLVRLNGQVA